MSQMIDREFFRAMGVREYSPEEREEIRKESARQLELFLQRLRDSSYSEQELYTRFNLSAETCAKMVQENRLLMWTDPSDPSLRFYPIEQFTESGKVHSWLQSVLDCLGESSISSLAKVSFFLSPMGHYGGRSRMEALKTDISLLSAVQADARALGYY